MKEKKINFVQLLFSIKRNRICLIGIVLPFLFGIYQVGDSIFAAGISGFLPLVDVKVINYYPLVFLGQMFNVFFCFMVIFVICAIYGFYIEKQFVILPLFYGFNRKQIFRRLCIGIFMTAFGLYFLCFIMLEAVGLPLEFLYLGNRNLYQQYGAMAAPLSPDNLKIAFYYLMLQYIATLPVVGICILLNVLLRKRIIAGGLTVLSYVGIISFTMPSTWLKWVSCYFYQENFINVNVMGDEVRYSYLPDVGKYMAGIAFCVLSAVLLAKIAEKSFVLADDI